MRNPRARLAAPLLLTLASLLGPAHAAAATEKASRRSLPRALVCRGNRSTSCDFILSYLFLSAGDTIDEREIREATIRLRWLRNFESVSIYLEKGSERGRAKVVVEDQRGDAVYLSGGGGRDLRGSQHRRVGGRQAHALQPVRRRKDSRLLGEIGSCRSTGRCHGAIGRASNTSTRTWVAANGSSRAPVSGTRTSGANGTTAISTMPTRVGADLSAGVRLWSFSYVTAGYRFRPVSQVYSQMHQRDGTYDVRSNANNGGLSHWIWLALGR